MKLLNIDANAKTVKGQKQGFMTAILYLSPFKAAGINLCPMAELAGCWKGCLNTAGHGGMAKGNARFTPYTIELPDNPVQYCRIKRTRFWADDRAGFLAQLCTEIEKFQRRAERKGLTPVVRLNGTSDIQWERIVIPGSGDNRRPFSNKANIFETFPELQFYDYTKIAKRFDRELPANYHLDLSYSEASSRYAQMCRDAHRKHGMSMVMVYRDKDAVARARMFYEEFNVNVVDGDANDLRFLDPVGSMVLLKAKGTARKDQSGFVLD